MAGYRRLIIAIASLALCQIVAVNADAEEPMNLQLTDLLSPQWLEDMKPGRESAKDIEFEAFAVEGEPEDAAADEAKPSGESQEKAAPVQWDMFSNSNFKDMPKGFRRHFAYYLVFVAVLMLYAALGFYRNHLIAKKSALELFKVLDEYFAFVDESPSYFERISFNRFRVFATGRTSCNCIDIEFRLTKRQCPFHEWILSRFTRMEDVVTMDLWLPEMDCVIFAMTEKLTNRSFVDKNEELTKTMHVHETAEIPSSLRAYINSKEKCVTTYASHCIALLKDFFPHLKSLYIVDSVPEVSGYRKYNRIKLELKFNRDLELLLQILKAVILLADFTKNYNVKDKTRETIEKNREEMVAIIFKQERKEAIEEARTEASKNSPVNMRKLEKKMMARPTPRVKIIR